MKQSDSYFVESSAISTSASSASLSPDSGSLSGPQHSLVVTNTKSKSLWLYDILTPFCIIMETCRECDDLYGFYQFSPQTYTSTHIEGSNAEPIKNRPLHKHSCIEIMYVLSGSVTNRVENQIFTYEAGQCCVMNKNIRHCETFEGDFQAVFFMLRDDFILELLDAYHKNEYSDALYQNPSPIFQLIEDSQNETLQFDKVYLDYFPVIPAEEVLDELSPIFNLIIQETINRLPGAGFFLKGAFTRLFYLLNDPNFFSVSRVHSDSDSQEYIFNKMSHIITSSHGRCTRQDLSEKLHYNGEYLNRIMKKYTGKTILEYGQTIFLEDARKLLSDTDRSISSIITELGFSNRSHFYRLFEKYYGETPLDYRKRCKAES